MNAIILSLIILSFGFVQSTKVVFDIPALKDKNVIEIRKTLV